LLQPRKAVFVKLLVVLIGACVGCSIGWAAPNLLPNPGFEQGERGAAPADWSGQGITEDVTGSVRLSAKAYRGSYSMQVECRESTGIYAAFCHPIAVSDTEGAELAFTCYYRTEGEPLPELTFVTFAEDFLVREWKTPALQTESYLMPDTRKWRLGSWRFEYLPGTRQVIVLFRLNGEGRLYVDDACLTRYPPEVSCSIESPGLVSGLPARRQCVLRLTNNTDTARQVRVTVTPLTGKRVFKSFSKRITLARRASSVVKLDYTLNYNQSCELQVTVTDDKSDAVLDCRQAHVPGLLAATIREPAFRGSILSSLPGNDIVVAGYVNATEELRQAVSLNAELVGTGIKASVENGRIELAADRSFTITLPGANILTGKYKVRLRGQVKQFEDIVELPVSRIPAGPSEVGTDGQGRLWVQGQPVFPRGIFGAMQPPDLAPIAAAGFNLAVVPSRRASSLLMKQAQQAGLGVLVSGNSVDSEFWGRQEERLGDFTSLVGWYQPAENERLSKIPPAIARAFYDKVTEASPYHPMVTAVRSAAAVSAYADAGDIMAVWISPRAGTDDRLIPYMVDRAVQAMAPRPVWAVIDLSGLSWYSPGGKADNSSVHRPTAAHLRAMTYLALMRGAKGLLYYSYYLPYYRGRPEFYIRRDAPKLWEELKRINSELRWLAPVVTEGRRTVLPPLAGGIVQLTQFEVGGARYLMAANVSDQEVVATFPTPGPASALNVLFEDRTLAPAGPGTFADHFAPHAVHVYLAQ